MRFRSILKMAAIASVILLCIGFVAYFYFRMAEIDRLKDYDLYSVVPSNAIAIVDSDNIIDLLAELNERGYSKNEGLHGISLLFSQLKDHINILSSEKPNYLNRKMGKILLSFHEPVNNRNQVLYCRLGADDKDVINKFIKKYCKSSFPTKYSEYKGEEISIYMMPDETFIASYLTSDFLAISYQKKLIEQVIDSKLSGNCILDDPGFSPRHTTARNQHPAIIHLKLDSIHIGRDEGKVSVGRWTEFSLKMKPDAICFAGVNHIEDSTANFMNVLKTHEPVGNLSADMFPASTFYIKSHAMEDPENRELEIYLEEHSQNQVTACMFYPSDSVHSTCMVVNIPVKNQVEAERALRNLATGPASGTYRTYSLPENASGFTYACFYKGNMLVGPNDKSITAYIDMIEKGDTLEKNAMYEVSKENLSDSYSFLLVADLEEMYKQPQAYSGSVPHFFFSNNDFFKHFILSSQFTCVDNVVYPTVFLLCKDEVTPTYAHLLNAD